jgi:PKD domain
VNAPVSRREGGFLVTRILRALIVSTGVLALSLASAPEANAQPGNDEFANATVIDGTALPFSDTLDTTGATTEAGEPSGGCPYQGGTVWYAITPSSDIVFRVNTSTSDYLNVYTVYTGSSLNALSFAGCGFWYQQISFRATAGTTYYIQVGGYFPSGGVLRLTVSQVPPPPNDDFANATVVDPSSLPFSDSHGGLAATLEPGEPVASCNGLGPPDNSWWYAFTPNVADSYTISTYSNSAHTVAVYSGGSLDSLSEEACAGGSRPFSFAAMAGTTYHIQIGDFYAGQYGDVSFSLDVAPDPVAFFFPSLADPSQYDTVQFYEFSSDPGGNAFSTKVWDFGDGTTETNPGQFPTHRFAADGDYAVQLTVTTTDGRTASTSQVMLVRTHDVAISRFLSPMSASVGQTRTIVVGITNHRYPEDVEVQLFRSIPGGSQLLDALTQHVAVLPGNRTTTFAFSYTFTSDDAALGKVTFKAVATILHARDALPGDNEAVAGPTKVM